MTSSSDSKQKLWDAPVRLFHWLIVILFGVSWYTGDQGLMDWHQWSGIAILTLVITRILWGFFGSTTARFNNFLKGPGRIIRYIKDIATGQHKVSPGHTPPGGWMVLVLILGLLTLPILGLFANDDIFFEGPLFYLVDKDMSDLLTSYHKLGFDIVMILVIVHIVAVVLYRLVLKDDLITPMITGKRTLPTDLSAGLRFTSPLWAIVALAVTAAAVYYVVLV